MAGTVIADRLEAASTSQLVIENGVALTPPTIVDVNNVQIGTFCRAWVNFNGTGTVAIRASFNVTSITDGGTGVYTLNFTNAFSDISYSIVGAANTQSGGAIMVCPNSNTSAYTPFAPTTSACKIGVTNYSAVVDCEYINIAVFR
jgi:hypothetical protein